VESQRFKIIFDKVEEVRSNKILYKDIFETLEMGKEIETFRQIVFDINDEQESSVFTKT
jgi:hypothetical protein